MSMTGQFLRVSPTILRWLLADTTRIQPLFEASEDDGEVLDVEKAWHGLHYLLTGDPWAGDSALADVVLGGTELGPDMGYGPARYLTPERVAAAAGALASMTRDELRRRYDPSTMSRHRIYPDIWMDPHDDGLGFLMPSFARVRAYYLDAAAKRHAMMKRIV
jgi:hypothetical protein